MTLSQRRVRCSCCSKLQPLPHNGWDPAKPAAAAAVACCWRAGLRCLVESLHHSEGVSWRKQRQLAGVAVGCCQADCLRGLPRRGLSAAAGLVKEQPAPCAAAAAKHAAFWGAASRRWLLWRCQVHPARLKQSCKAGGSTAQGSAWICVEERVSWCRLRLCRGSGSCLWQLGFLQALLRVAAMRASRLGCLQDRDQAAAWVLAGV